MVSDFYAGQHIFRAFLAFFASPLPPTFGKKSGGDDNTWFPRKKTLELDDAFPGVSSLLYQPSLARITVQYRV